MSVVLWSPNSCSGCWNVSHYCWQQSFSRLHSPLQSDWTIISIPKILGKKCCYLSSVISMWKKRITYKRFFKKRLDIHLFFSFLLSCSCFFGLFLQIISKITTTSIKEKLYKNIFDKYNQQPKTIITGITITIRILVIMISIIINIIIIIAIMIIKRLLHLIIAAQQNDQFWKFIG